MHLIDLPAMRMSRTPITNDQYARFAKATHHAPPSHWEAPEPPASLLQAPVTYVTWEDAQAFCEWAGCRLPSEAEWEKGARGGASGVSASEADTRIWPWGNQLPDATRCHFDQQRQGIPPGDQRVSDVGKFPAGASPYGLLDMAGNVWEWTASAYAPYPWTPATTKVSTEVPVVLRGGSYNHDANGVRCSARTAMSPGARDVYIGFRVAVDGGTRTAADLDLIDIPAGPCWMGSQKSTRQCAVLADELPQHEVAFGAYQIASTPVTNGEYLEFVQATACEPPANWRAGRPPAGQKDHPVTHVDWRDATAFAQWAGCRLPTEVEWERAAAGVERRIYPWGDAPPSADHLDFNGHRGTSPVGRYPHGATPDGIMDMAGNVWEWTQSRYGPYPYDGSGERDTLHPAGRRVLRGGSFLSPSAAFVRCAMRSLSYESRRREHIGFRLARSLPGEEEVNRKQTE